MCYVCLRYIMLMFRALSELELSTPTLVAYGADDEVSSLTARLVWVAADILSRLAALEQIRLAALDPPFSRWTQCNTVLSRKTRWSLILPRTGPTKKPHTTVTTRDTERNRVGHKVYLYVN
jgi:hypothetical protein